MPLVDMNTLVGIAKKNDVMLPAFNTTNMEMTLAIMDAFEANGMPGIVQIAPTNVKLTGYDFISEVAHLAVENYTVPMALHLDHGKTLDDVRQAVNAGFTSIMIDGAALPFEENIRFSRGGRFLPCQRRARRGGARRHTRQGGRSRFRGGLQDRPRSGGGVRRAHRL